MTAIKPWDFDRGCGLLMGLESSARTLIAEYEKQLAQDGSSLPASNQAAGKAIACTMMSAYFCEMSLKTLQALVWDGYSSRGHDLQLLYREAEQAYNEKYAPEELDVEVKRGILTANPPIPPSWRPLHVELFLAIGKSNFTDWRYSATEYVEGTEDVLPAMPREIFAISAGIFRVCAGKHPILGPRLRRFSYGFKE